MAEESGVGAHQRTQGGSGRQPVGGLHRVGDQQGRRRALLENPYALTARASAISPRTSGLDLAVPKLQSTQGGNSIDVLGLARVVDQFRANASFVSVASLGEEG